MSVRVLVGDALTVLRTLPSESVHCVVTSPPYFALRDYGVEGQIGLEQTPAEFIAKLVAVFDEVRRVLRSDGTCWVNLGDSYAGSGKGPTGIGDQEQRQGFVGVSSKSTLRGYTAGSQLRQPILGGGGGVAGIPAKNLLLIPERFAIAMQDAGWYVRSRIAWCKKSAMPESVRDRPTSAWEHVWLFSKSPRYFYDAEAVRQPYNEASSSRYQYAMQGTAPGGRQPGGDIGRKVRELGIREPNPAGANLRNFWLLGPAPSSLEHYASFPPELPKRCILAGTSERGCCPSCGAPWRRCVERAVEGERKPFNEAYHRQSQHSRWGQFTPDTVTLSAAGVKVTKTTTGWAPGCSCPPAEPRPCTILDPFLGSGTTLLVASRLGRAGIGVELNAEYARMSMERITSDCPMFASVEAS